MAFRPLPIGVDDFGKLITKDYYYVDKTRFIQELIDKRGEVNLFTRPRRFGKTLNMSMLKYFFEDTGDEVSNEKNRALFEGLEIMKAGETYTSHMGQYPVISVTLKSAKQPSFELAMLMLKRQIISEFERHRDIISALGEDARRYQRILDGEGGSGYGEGMV